MDMDTIELPVSVFIEIEKGSDHKYEYNKQTQSLELDILVINDQPLPRDHSVNGYITGALLMEDENRNDPKILTIPVDEYESGGIHSVYDAPSHILLNIQAFFANYKKAEPDKWSIVNGFVGKPAAIQLYKQSLGKND